MTWRNVLGMLVLVVLCAGALWFLRDEETDGPSVPTTILEVFDRRDVQSITAGGDGVEFKVRRRPDASDSWDLQVATEWARANAVQVDEILLSLANATVHDAFPAEGGVAGYGLDNPSVSVTLELPGEQRMARFGTRTREGTGVYADRGPETDVMIVSVAPHDELIGALSEGLRDRRLSDLRTYDVRKIEIVQAGVTTLEAQKDVTSVWRISQPFKGYADPSRFETRISHILNEQWKSVVDEGVRDLPRYGLVRPSASVTLTSKREVSRTIHLGNELGDGGDRYAKEDEYGTVYVVSKRFADALLESADEVRDRSFARLGLGVLEVTVRLDDASYVLSKAHTEWEIEKPVREPAEEDVVEQFLETIRSWHVVEFLDGEDAAAYGISSSGSQIQVESEGGALATFLIGNATGNGNYYAQRLEDGQPVIVLGGPVEAARQGWLHFMRRSALELNTDEIDFVARDGGSGPGGAGVTDEKWRRELDRPDPAWKPLIGQTGAGLDATAMTRLLEALYSVRPVDWVHWDASRNAELGFAEGGGAADTAWMEIDFRPEASRNPVYILIGKRVPGASPDARYARIKGQKYAFVMDAETVGRLTAPLMRK